MRKSKYNAFDSSTARRRRHDLTIRVRKEKKASLLARRRKGSQPNGEGGMVTALPALIAALESPDPGTNLHAARQACNLVIKEKAVQTARRVLPRFVHFLSAPNAMLQSKAAEFLADITMCDFSESLVELGAV